MIPRTGPNHSVVCVHDPGRTPTRTPGDHTRPASSGPASSSSGSISHRSPGSSSVSARSSFPDGGAMTGPTVAADRVGRTDRQALDRVDQLVDEPGVVGDGADADRQAGGRALLTGVAEGGPDEVGDGEVEVGRRRDDERVLPAGLGEHRHPRVPAPEGRRGLERPRSARSRRGEDRTPAPARGRRRRRARSGARPAGTPADQQASATSSAHRRVSGAGLRTTVLPAASAASTPPAGMATGKFHGGATSTTPRGRCSRPGIAVSSGARSA